MKEGKGMSTYYEFYAAIEKDGKIEAIGSYIRKGGGYRLIPILSRSRSFIQWDDFGCWNLPIEKMTEDQIEFFTDTGWISDERQSISYYIPYKDIAALADDGLIQGYVTLDELNMVSAAHYSQDALWDIWVKTPEVAARNGPGNKETVWAHRVYRSLQYRIYLQPAYQYGGSHRIRI